MVVQHKIKEDFTDKIVDKKFDELTEEINYFPKIKLKDIHSVMIFCKKELKMDKLNYEIKLCFVFNSVEYDKFIILGEGDLGRVETTAMHDLVPMFFDDAEKIIYIHNHPEIYDGNYYPSETDIESIISFKEILKRYGIEDLYGGSYIYTQDMYTHTDVFLEEEIDGIELDEKAFFEF